MSRRPTSSASEALAQRRLERRLPARLDVDPRPQARQRFEAVPGEPGLELAFGLDLLLQRAQRLEPGARGRRARRASSLTASCCARRASSSAGTRSLPARAGGLRPHGARLGRGGALPGGVQPRRVGAAPGRLFFGDQAIAPALGLARACSSTLRSRRRAPGSAAARRRRRSRCSSLRRLRLAQRRLRAPAVAGAASSACAASSSAAARSAAAICSATLLAARPAPRPRALDPVLVLRSSARQPLRSIALPAFDDVADALFEPAHLERRLGRARPAPRAARRWPRSAPGGSSRARPRRGAARRSAPRARWSLRRPRVFTRSSSLRRVAVLQEPELVLLERAARCCSVR